MFAESALTAELERLRRFAFRLTRNNADADDLVQSTCLRALEKSDHFEDGTNLFSWSSKIMFNIFVTGYRRKTKFENKYDPEIFLEQASVESSQDIRMELAEVSVAMMKLRAEQREILVMICVKGMHYEEVSEALQIPVGTVRSRLSRARAQLQVVMATTSALAHTQAGTPATSANTNMPVVPAYIAARALQRA